MTVVYIVCLVDLKAFVPLPIKGSASAEAEKSNRVEVKKKKRRGGTQLEEVLDAFIDFCEQYR